MIMRMTPVRILNAIEVLLIAVGIGFIAWNLPELHNGIEREPEDVWLALFWLGSFTCLGILCLANGLKSNGGSAPVGKALIAGNIIAILVLAIMLVAGSSDPALRLIVLVLLVGPASMLAGFVFHKKR